MPPRDDQELPEGTDQIINGAMETGAGAGASTGSGFGGVGSGGTTPGGSADFAGSGGTTGAGSGFSSGSGGSYGSGSGTGATGGSYASGGGTGTTGGSGFIGGSGGDDTGGFSSSGSAGLGGGSGLGGSAGGASGGGSGSSPTDQVKGGVQGLKSQATDKVRSYAVDGKQRATTALDDLSQVVNEAAQSIDDRLGPQYGDYARRAATAVSGFADTVRDKDVDELFDDARDIVRKSPGVAIGAAAVIGFSLVRLLKAGMPDQQNRDVDFQPDPALSSSTGTGLSSTSTGTTGMSSAGTGTTSSQAPYVASSTTSGV